MSLTSRIQHAYNAFVMNKDPTYRANQTVYSYGQWSRPDRMHFTRGNERSIVTAVFNRIALDVAAMTVKHVRLDKNGRFTEELNTGLNYCLTSRANIDQTSRAFLQDAAQSLMDEGCIAILPVDTFSKTGSLNSFDVETMRVGKVLEWFPNMVRIRAYNEKTGEKEDILMPKNRVGIIENPFYSVMNEPNSVVQRLIRKLNILDAIDEQSSSGKLDLILQLPYSVKTDTRKVRAEDRVSDIEHQLKDSKYGIAYIDSTEHVTQLNRSINNNLMTQIEYLTSLMYSQLSITQSIMDGTADEATMLHYYNRTIEPIIFAITDEIQSKFLTKVARAQGQSIFVYRDPFKLVPVSQIAEIADKFTRNAIMTSNEIRQIVGMTPSSEPVADELRNKNLNEPTDAASVKKEYEEEGENQNGE